MKKVAILGCENSHADGFLQYIKDNPNFPGMDGIPEYRLVKIENGTVTVQPADVVAMAKRYNKKTIIIIWK